MINIEFGKDKELDTILANFYAISKSAVLEQSSKAGSIMKDRVRASFKNETTEWSQNYIENKKDKTVRRLVKGRLGSGFSMVGGNFALGHRVSHLNQTNSGTPASMVNFIQSYTSEGTGTTTVGGMFKGYRPIYRKNTKVVGKGKYQSGISPHTRAILEKLNYGDRSGQFSRYLRWGRKSASAEGSSESIEQFEGKWKARHFFEKGFSSGKGIVLQTMTRDLQKLIGNVANNTDLSRRMNQNAI